jgi:hypothetical protein
MSGFVLIVAMFVIEPFEQAKLSLCLINQALHHDGVWGRDV